MYKLKRIDTDMWSRCVFVNLETNEEISFECNNDVAYSILQKSFNNNDYQFEWFDYDKFDNMEPSEMKTYIQTLNNNSSIIFLSECGTPIQAEFGLDYSLNSTYEFMFEELYNLKYKELSFLNFNNEYTEYKISTFHWHFSSWKEHFDFIKKSIVHTLDQLLI